MSNERISKLLAHLVRDYANRGPAARKRFFSDVRPLLPYCIEKLRTEAGEPAKWLVLNRDYKPIGIIGTYYANEIGGVSVFAGVKYEDFREYAVTFVNPPESAHDLWSERRSDRLYLYDDGIDVRIRLSRISRLGAMIAEQSRLITA